MMSTTFGGPEGYCGLAIIAFGAFEFIANTSIAEETWKLRTLSSLNGGG